MIRVILNGCNGKMGRVIQQCISESNNLTLVAGIDKNNKDNPGTFPVYSTIEECTVEGDVILDFSRAEALGSIMPYAIEKKLPIILCTTGFTEDQLAYIKDSSNIIPVFRSANMSIGVNLLSSVLKKISPILFGNYDIEIIEKHHNQKVDAPSGTALLLANAIKDSLKDQVEYVYGREGNAKRTPSEIGIHAIRGGNIVGDHDVIFAGAGEVIEISHKAISREVFAVGALRACEYMAGKAPGLYSMKDVLNLE